MKVIDFYRKREELLMKKGEILYKIDCLRIGEKIKIYSETKDLFDNDNIEKYTISKELDGVYIEYAKSTGFDNEDKIEFKEKVNNIGTKFFDEENYKTMKLSKSEINTIRHNSIEQGLIRKGYNLVGTYENGLVFDFENIIMVSH